MTLSSMGTTGLFTVGGVPYPFEVDVSTSDVTRRTSAEGATHHIPGGNVNYIQSAGMGVTTFGIPIYCRIVDQFLALESITGSIGSLYTLQDGLWNVARLDVVERLHVYPDNSIEARLTFTAAQFVAPGQVV